MIALVVFGVIGYIYAGYLGVLAGIVFAFVYGSIVGGFSDRV